MIFRESLPLVVEGFSALYPVTLTSTKPQLPHGRRVRDADTNPVMDAFPGFCFTT